MRQTEPQRGDLDVEFLACYRGRSEEVGAVARARGLCELARLPDFVMFAGAPARDAGAGDARRLSAPYGEIVLLGDPFRGQSLDMDLPGLAGASRTCEDFLLPARGNFLAFAWNPREGLRVLSDGSSDRRCYWALDDRGVVMSDSLAGLMELPRARRLDPRACREMVFAGFPLGDRTLLDGHRFLPPNTCLHCRPDGVATYRYRVPRHSPTSSEGDAAQDLPRTITDLAVRATHARLPRSGTGKVGLLLTGGKDSRIVLGSLLEAKHPSELIAFTYGRRGTYDVEIAALVAKYAGVAHVVMGPPRGPCPAAERRNDAAVQLVRMAGMADPLQRIPPRFHDAIAGQVGTVFTGVNGAAMWGFRRMVLDAVESPEALADLIVRSELKWEKQGFRSIEEASSLLGPEFEELRATFREDVEATGMASTVFAVEAWYERYRNPKFTAHAVRPCVPGLRFESPLWDASFEDLIMALPLSVNRSWASYYSAALTETKRFGRLFSLPLRNEFGLPLTAPPVAVTVRRNVMRAVRVANGCAFSLGLRWAVPDPMEGHTDVARAIRWDRDFRALIRSLLEASFEFFDEHKVLHLLDLHLRGRRDYSKVLTRLASVGLARDVLSAPARPA